MCAVMSNLRRRAVDHETLADVLIDKPDTPEQVTAAFRKALDELGETPSGLASRMKRLGDKRPYESILRGIQRMAAGDTRVSGEMHALLEMMNRERRRAKFESSKLQWNSINSGCVTAKLRDFTITLSAQSRGRWHVNLVHLNGYSPPWPSWQPSLEEAKIRALICLDDALNDLQQNLEHT
jgi:hypothetical protein